MTALQGAVESAAPVSRLHEHQSFALDDFPVPVGPGRGMAVYTAPEAAGTA